MLSACFCVPYSEAACSGVCSKSRNPLWGENERNLGFSFKHKWPCDIYLITVCWACIWVRWVSGDREKRGLSIKC